MAGVNSYLLMVAWIGGLLLQVDGYTYYTDSSYDCGNDHYVFTTSKTTVKAWSSYYDKKSTSSCTMYFDTGIEGDVIRVEFSEIELPCSSDAKLTFYDGSSTSDRVLKTFSCTSLKPGDFRSSGKYLTVEFTSSSFSTDYDFDFDLWEVEGDSLSIGIIMGIVSGVVFIICFLSGIVCMLIRRHYMMRQATSRQPTTVMMPTTQTNMGYYPSTGQVNAAPGFGPPPSYGDATAQNAGQTQYWDPSSQGQQAGPGATPGQTPPYPTQQSYAPYPQQQGVAYPQQQGVAYPQQQGVAYPQQQGNPPKP